MMRPIALGLGVVVVLAAAAGAWWQFGGPEEESGALLRPGDAALVTQGMDIYAEACAECHGAALQGEADWQQRKPDGRLPAPPHDPGGHTWHHPDVQLFALTKRGPAALVGGGYESDMPGFEGDLSDDEIVAVLSYIKSTWPEEIRARHDEINRRAAGG